MTPPCVICRDDSLFLFTHGKTVLYLLSSCWWDGGGAELYVFNIYSILVNIFILFSIFAATLLIFVCLCLFSSSFIVLVDSSSWIFLPFSNMCCVSVPLLQGSLYCQHCCSCIKYDTDWLCLKHHS